MFCCAMTSTSTYGSTLSGGTQGVIDDIADRRYRTHFLKDRSASNARINLRGDNGEDKRASYKAWGRTQSGILAESLMTPKEINLIWGWYSPIMSANSKDDVVDVNILISQFMSAGTFDTLGDANNFMRSIKRRQEGAVSFAELTTAIANYDVSTEHVFELRQFAKKLKAIKKDKKSRPLSGKGSGSRVDHVFARGHEEARKSLLSKAKSENHVGVFPTLNLTPVVADSDDSSANLPVINSGRGQRQRETLPDHTSTSVHSDTMVSQERSRGVDGVSCICICVLCPVSISPVNMAGKIFFSPFTPLILSYTLVPCLIVSPCHNPRSLLYTPWLHNMLPSSRPTRGRRSQHKKGPTISLLWTALPYTLPCR